MKKRRLRAKTKLIILAVTAAVIAFVIVFMNNAASVIIAVGCAQMRAFNTMAVNDAVDEVLADGLNYSDIIDITYDSDGDVSTISANTTIINFIARRTAGLTQTKLTEAGEGGIDIPIGAFTGIEAISGMGSKIKIKIMPVVAVECVFLSRFSRAGINQTIHSIYIQVVSEITIVLAARTERVEAEAQVLVCESIINGEVPQIYLQGGILGSG